MDLYCFQTGISRYSIHSDFIWDFGKLPFPTHLGKYFNKIGKIRAKIHEIGKIKAIFGLGMTPIYGLKNGQIKSLIHFENKVCSIPGFIYQELYNDLNVYCRELAPSTVNLTGDRAQGKDSKHCPCSTHWKHLERVLLSCQPRVTVTSCFIYKVIRDV